MSIAIDAVLVLIVVYCAIRGLRSGFIRGIFGVVAIIVAIFGANLAAKAFSSELSGVLEPLVGSTVNTAVTSVLHTDEEQGQTDTTNVYDVSLKALEKMGIADNAAKRLADRVGTEIDNVGQQMKSSLTSSLSDSLSYIVVFAIAFILLMIVFTVIGNIINVAFSLPGLALPDKIIGLAFGLAKGLLIVLTLAVILRYLGILSPDVIENTTVLKYILNINPLADILGV